jgi:hypothetical protein
MASDAERPLSLADERLFGETPERSFAHRWDTQAMPWSRPRRCRP